MTNIVHNCDCMEFMKDLPENAYDLAIVDPPYGIGQTWSKSKRDQFYYRKQNYLNDKIPGEAYFFELFRISKNQIVWGANYFPLLWPSNNLIIWDKKRDVRKTFMSEAEIAWHSFSRPIQVFEHQWDGAKKGVENGIKKIHPFQKPIGLYKSCLLEHAVHGQTIFDSHVGSGSIRIACHDLGFDFEGCEIDTDYWYAQEERYQQHAAQAELFHIEDIAKSIYGVAK